MLVALYGDVLLNGAWLSSRQGLLVLASNSGGIVVVLLCIEASLFSCPLTSIFYLQCCC